MELETKPDDSSLEIGDGGQLKTIRLAKITGNLSECISHQQQPMILYSDGEVEEEGGCQRGPPALPTASKSLPTASAD